MKAIYLNILSELSEDDIYQLTMNIIFLYIDTVHTVQ